MILSVQMEEGSFHSLIWPKYVPTEGEIDGTTTGGVNPRFPPGYCMPSGFLGTRCAIGNRRGIDESESTI